jgi:integrase
MTKNVAEIVYRRCQTVRGKCLFKKDKHTVNPVGQKIRRAFRNACEQVGIPYGIGLNNGAVFHTIRHSTTTELIVNQKQPLPTVMKITRHSSVKTLMRYTHPTPQAVEAAQASAQIDLTLIDNAEA